MFKLVTSSKERSIYRLFHGFEDEYDGWGLNNPAVFEYIKKKYDDDNYFVTASFMSGRDDEKDYLLVFLKKNTDYLISCPLYDGEDENLENKGDINHCLIQIYDYKKKAYSNDNIGLEKIGDILRFGPEVNFENNERPLHVVNLPQDTYCLFEIWMNEPFEDYQKRLLNINFTKNIPNGGNYKTRYFRDFGLIDSNSKWSISGKVYARRSVNNVKQDINTEFDYKSGVIIETSQYSMPFESFEEAELIFQSEHKIICDEINFNEEPDGYNLSTLFGNITIKAMKISGYFLNSEEEKEKQFLMKYGENNRAVIKINDVICFSKENNEVYTENIKLKNGMNPFVIYFMLENINSKISLNIVENFGIQLVQKENLFHSEI